MDYSMPVLRAGRIGNRSDYRRVNVNQLMPAPMRRTRTGVFLVFLNFLKHVFMNHRNHQTLAGETSSAHASGAMKKIARTFATFVMTGLFLCAGVGLNACSTNLARTQASAAVPAQNTKEIVPGLTVVFPAPPKAFVLPGAGRNNAWMATTSIDGHPARFIAGRMSYAAYGKMGQQVMQLLRMAPDYFARTAPMGEGYLSRIAPTLRDRVSLTEVKRTPATAGFPGVAYAWRNIPFPSDPSGSPASPASSTFAQFHGYSLFVNGEVVMLGLIQQKDAQPDPQALTRFVAAAHFPPADKVGTLEEQMKAVGRYAADMGMIPRPTVLTDPVDSADSAN